MLIWGKILYCSFWDRFCTPRSTHSTGHPRKVWVCLVADGRRVQTSIISWMHYSFAYTPPCLERITPCAGESGEPGCVRWEWDRDWSWINSRTTFARCCLASGRIKPLERSNPRIILNAVFWNVIVLHRFYQGTFPFQLPLLEGIRQVFTCPMCKTIFNCTEIHQALSGNQMSCLSIHSIQPVLLWFPSALGGNQICDHNSLLIALRVSPVWGDTQGQDSVLTLSNRGILV